MRKKFFFYLIRNKYFIYSSFALITFITLLLTLLPAENIGSSRIFQFDKIGHFLLFYFWTLSFGLLVTVKAPERINIVFVIATGAIFGIMIEVIQYLMPFGRGIDFADAVADILGSIAAGFTLYFLKKRYKEVLNP